MPHDHDHHAHDHHDHHAVPSDPNRAFALGVVLNVAFVVIGVVAGIAAHSTALLADAAHNLGDVLGLAMAWGATVLAQRARTTRRTYGLKRSTIVAALVNAMVILFAIGGVSWEAVQRLAEPRPVEGGIVAAVAAVGVAINGIAAMLFAKGRDRDLNMRGAFMHLVADAIVSAGVVISGLVVWQTGWSWIDPIASLAVSVVILIGTLRLLREATDLLLDAVPPHVDPEAVSTYLTTVSDVCDVHDLHIWSMSTTEIAMTAHLVVRWPTWSPAQLREVAREIEHRFGIGHVTIQLEPDDQLGECRHAVDGAV
jgi:cobalt-zinc-cadmium efflux system protein